MMANFSTVHISGDLGQALATQGGATWVFESGAKRPAGPNDVAIFFTYSFESIPVAGVELEGFSEADLLFRLSHETRKHAALRAFLVGMDPEFDLKTRRNELLSIAPLLEDQEILAFVQRRALRVPDTGLWDASQGASLAASLSIDQIAEIYTIIDGDELEHIEAAVRRWAPNGDQRSVEALLSQARESGVIAEFALALHRRDTSQRGQAANLKGDPLDPLRLHLDRILPGSWINRFQEPPGSLSFPVQLPPAVSPQIDNSHYFARIRTFKSDRIPGGVAIEELLQRILVLAGTGVDEAIALETCLRYGDYRLFFGGYVRAPDQKSAGRLFQIVNEELSYDRRMIPSRKAWQDLLERRPMRLSTAVVLDLALQEMISRSRFEREVGAIMGQLSGLVVIPSVFHADPQALRDLRGFQASQANLSRAVFGRSGRDVWRMLEREEDPRAGLFVTWATVQAIAREVGTSAFSTFSEGALRRQLTIPVALSPDDGNRIAPPD